MHLFREKINIIDGLGYTDTEAEALLIGIEKALNDAAKCHGMDKTAARVYICATFMSRILESEMKIRKGYKTPALLAEYIFSTIKQLSLQYYENSRREEECKESY